MVREREDVVKGEGKTARVRATELVEQAEHVPRGRPQEIVSMEMIVFPSMILDQGLPRIRRPVQYLSRRLKPTTTIRLQIIG